MKIWLDLDGTIVGLYNVDNWLEMLTAHDPTPYAIAKPLVNMSLLARYLNRCQCKGIEICVVTALAKNSTIDYDNAVIEAKKRWLAKHLRSVHFNDVRFVSYTTVKNSVNAGSDILFDDEERHLSAWTGKAYHASNILSVLKQLAYA